MRGGDFEIYEDEKYWILGENIFELRSCNLMM